MAGVFAKKGGSSPPSTPSAPEKKSFIANAAEDTQQATKTKQVAQGFKPPTLEFEEDDISKTIEKLLSNTELDSGGNNYKMMLYGSDGTGKSGIILDFLSDEDIENGMRALVIDLDGGNVPLLKTHHAKRVKKAGRTLSDVYMVENPLSIKRNEAGEYEVDYHQTFTEIMKLIHVARTKGKELKIKFIVFDGLSTALKHAERLMRLEKNIAPDGGVQTRYWLVRNQVFEETLEQIKSLPISTFFIAHENFILSKDGDDSKIIQKTNAMMHQKLRCVRKVNGNVTRFSAIVDKTKYDTSLEGAEFVFCEVDNKEHKVLKWDTQTMWKRLGMDGE